MFGIPVFGEIAKMVRELVKLIKDGRLPKEEVKKLILDARMGAFERKERKKRGEE